MSSSAEHAALPDSIFDWADARYDNVILFPGVSEPRQPITFVPEPVKDLTVETSPDYRDVRRRAEQKMIMAYSLALLGGLVTTSVMIDAVEYRSATPREVAALGVGMFIIGAAGKARRSVYRKACQALKPNPDLTSIEVITHTRRPFDQDQDD